MKIRGAVALLFGLPTAVLAVSDVYELHGSGTSNPSKCYWSIMETLREQSDVPLHLTYRAVGSTQGIAEFTALFGNSSSTIVPKFGSGDIPLKTVDYAKTTTDGTATGTSQMYHLPVLIGAISFFHSVPDIEDLQLNACILSQIYQLQITSWGDDQIIALNPNLSSTARDTKIIVARRAEGSSSTYSSAEVRISVCVCVCVCLCVLLLLSFWLTTYLLWTTI
jgi:ABC-type phosphate transport system substrate-binding protein